MDLVDYLLLSQDPSLHKVERKLRQEDELVALEQPPTNPGEDRHAQRVAEVENSPVHRVRRLGLGDGLDKEGNKRIQRVLVHVVDKAAAQSDGDEQHGRERSKRTLYHAEISTRGSRGYKDEIAVCLTLHLLIHLLYLFFYGAIIPTPSRAQYLYLYTIPRRQRQLTAS